MAHNAPTTPLAVARVGALSFGVPTQHVVCALPPPPQLGQLPRQRGALEGVFVHRDRVVPLVNLRRWLRDTPADSAPTASAPTAQVLLVEHHDKVLGLAVDGLDGLIRVPPDNVRRVHQADQVEEFFHSVAVTGPSSPPLSVLDTGKLMQQTQSWSDSPVHGAPTAPLHTHTHGTAGPCEVLFGRGGLQWAVPAEAVAEVAPFPTRMQTVHLPARCVAGVVRWRQRDVPVVHLMVDGETTPEPGTNAKVMVLHHQGRHLALVVDEVLAVGARPNTALHGAHGAGAPCPDLLQGVFQHPQRGRVLVIDPSRLFAEYPIACISERLVNDTSGTSPAPTRTSGATANHLALRAGSTWALPMGSLLGVVVPPEHMGRVSPPHPQSLGTLDWQNHPMLVWDLRARLGLGASERNAQGRIVVVQHQGQVFGLYVEALTELLPPTAQADHLVGHANGGERMRWLTFQRDGQQRSYVVLDLDRLPPPQPSVH